MRFGQKGRRKELFFLSSTPKGNITPNIYYVHFFSWRLGISSPKPLWSMYGISTYIWLIFVLNLNIPYMDPMGKLSANFFFQSGGPSQNRFPWSMIKAKMVQKPWILVVNGGFGRKRSEETAEGFPFVGGFLRKGIIHESRMGCRCFVFALFVSWFFLEPSNSDRGEF